MQLEQYMLADLTYVYRAFYSGVFFPFYANFMAFCWSYQSCTILMLCRGTYTEVYGIYPLMEPRTFM